MVNATIEANYRAIRRERKRAIMYDNRHAGGIVTEKYRAETVEAFMDHKLTTLEQSFTAVVIMFGLVVLTLLCRQRQRQL